MCSACGRSIVDVFDDGALEQADALVVVAGQVCALRSAIEIVSSERPEFVGRSKMCGRISPHAISECEVCSLERVGGVHPSSHRPWSPESCQVRILPISVRVLHRSRWR